MVPTTLPLPTIPSEVVWAALILVGAGCALATVLFLVVRRILLRRTDLILADIARRLDSVVATHVEPLLRDGQGLPPAARQRMATMRSAAVGAARVSQRIVSSAERRGIDVDTAVRQLVDRLAGVARLMDKAVPLPLVGGIGLDAVVGLIPVVGDVATTTVSIAIIAQALQLGLPRELVSRMLVNVFVDLLVGYVPVVGDVADIAFKANTANLTLLKAHIEQRRRIDSQSHIVPPPLP
jgi:hypothetical protein